MKKEKIEDFLKEWKDKDKNQENVYQYAKLIDLDGFSEIEFEEVLSQFCENIQLKYNFTFINDIDLPNLYCSCYCLSFVENDKIYSYPIIFKM